jgi:hypothetical protein
VRLVIWKTADVIPDDIYTQQNDLYVRAWVEGQQPQETDIHWRCKKGKGSFNWRMKFPITLPEVTMTYLHLQLWDKDIIGSNDVIVENTLNLNKFFRQAFKAKKNLKYDLKANGASKPKKKKSHGLVTAGKQTGKYTKLDEKSKAKAKADVKSGEAQELVSSLKDMLGLPGKTPKGAQWLAMKDKQGNLCGKLCFSLEILTKKEATAKPNGIGRSEPNMYPIMPKPTGRLKLTAMWNPFYVLNEFLGPSMARKCYCICVCLAVTAIMVFGGPFLGVVVQFLNALPAEALYPIFAGVAILILASTWGCIKMCRSSSDDEDNGDEEETEALIPK